MMPIEAHLACQVLVNIYMIRCVALQWPGMVVLVVTGVYWTRGVERALSEGGKAVKAYEEKCTHDLMQVRTCMHARDAWLPCTCTSACTAWHLHGGLT